MSEGKPPTYVAEQIGDSVETLHRWYAHWFTRLTSVAIIPAASNVIEDAK